MARKHAGAQQARALPQEVFGVFVTVSCQLPPDEAGDGTPSGRAHAQAGHPKSEPQTGWSERASPQPKQASPVQDAAHDWKAGPSSSQKALSCCEGSGCKQILLIFSTILFHGLAFLFL